MSPMLAAIGCIQLAAAWTLAVVAPQPELQRYATEIAMDAQFPPICPAIDAELLVGLLAEARIHIEESKTKGQVFLAVGRWLKAQKVRLGAESDRCWKQVVSRRILRHEFDAEAQRKRARELEEAENKEALDAYQTKIREIDRALAQRCASNECAMRWRATTLVQFYRANEVRADEELKRRRVCVEGSIDNIGKDLFGTPYVSFIGPDNIFGTVQCMSNSPETTLKLADLRRHETITACGECNGLMGNVILDQCEIHDCAGCQAR